MPMEEPKPVVAFKFVAPNPMDVDGFGVLEPGQMLSIKKCKEVFGEGFVGNDLIVPVETGELDKERGEP